MYENKVVFEFCQDLYNDNQIDFVKDFMNRFDIFIQEVMFKYCLDLDSKKVEFDDKDKNIIRISYMANLCLSDEQFIIINTIRCLCDSGTKFLLLFRNINGIYIEKKL